VTRRGQLHAGILESDARGVRDRADRQQAVAALDRTAVRERDDDAVGGALDPSARDFDSTVMPPG
jgi:hypothetical protein